MANYNASNQTVLIDEPSAMIGGTFALLIAILGITVNSVTMYVILARKSIRLVFSMNLTDLSDPEYESWLLSQANTIHALTSYKDHLYKEQVSTEP